MGSAAVDDVGRYWIAFEDDGLDARVKVYDSSGTLVRIVGREGRRPGEFMFARSLDARAGRMLVFDAIQRTAAEYDRDFQLLKTHRFVGSLLGGGVALAEDRIAVNSVWRTRERSGYAVHIFGTEPVPSADVDTEVYRYDIWFSGWRALAGTARGTFWSAKKDRYLISEFDAQGRRLRTLEREVPWLTPVTGPLLTLDQPPPSYIAAIREDSSGRLWVLTSVADTRWRSAIREHPTQREPDGRPSPEIVYPERYRDAIIEVFDARTLRLVARGRTDRPLVRLFGDVSAAYGAIDSTGVPRVFIWNLEIATTLRSVR